MKMVNRVRVVASTGKRAVSSRPIGKLPGRLFSRAMLSLLRGVDVEWVQATEQDARGKCRGARARAR